MLDEVEWDCDGAIEIESTELVELLREKGESYPVGDNPADGKPITLGQWKDHGDDIIAQAKRQAEFDALPKLFPGIQPKLIHEETSE